MTGGQSKITTKVYPWHDLAWDLALADGIDPASIDSRFEEYSEISTHLLRDILEGKVPVRKPNGNPLHGDPKLFKIRGPDNPHLTVDEGNAWLKKNRYLQVWAPDDSKKTQAAQVDNKAELASTAPANNWRHQIQAAAYKRWLELRATGACPSVNSISELMAIWCRDNNIKGDKGQDPRAGTIRNTVLNAKSWTPPQHSPEQAQKHLAQTA